MTDTSPDSNNSALLSTALGATMHLISQLGDRYE